MSTELSEMNEGTFEEVYDLEKYEYVRDMLLKAGMAFFVRNYFELKCSRYERQNGDTPQRIAYARRIFKEGLHVDALHILSFSSIGESSLAKVVYSLEAGETPRKRTYKLLY